MTLRAGGGRVGLHVVRYKSSLDDYNIAASKVSGVGKMVEVATPYEF